jgi:hypothetical protein
MRLSLWIPILIRMKKGATVKRPFQFRARERDAETDQLRIGSVRQAIDTAVGAAVKERDALRARVSTARDLASFAVGTDDDEYLFRDTKDTSMIKEYERQMTIGEDRLRVLDQQIANLTALQDLSRRCFPS